MKLDKQQEVQNAVAEDSISSVGVSVNVKEYAPSEVFAHEPPPAYKKPKATAVQIARIAAFTVISCTVILGLCLIASSWIEATASCSQFIHADALLHHQQQNNDDVADRPSYQALVDPLQSDESSESKQESLAASASPSSPSPSPPPPPPPPYSHPSQSQSSPIQIKLPLQLDFDEIAGSLMEKNLRSRMNCVVEKKSAEEVTDHQAKTVRLPFGVNITTDPRYEHTTGERMAIYCESGHDQRHSPAEPMTMQQPTQHHAAVVMPMPMPMPMSMSMPMSMPMPMPMPMPMNAPMMMGHPSHRNHVPPPPPPPPPQQFNQMQAISMAAAAAAQAQAQQDDAGVSPLKEDGPITIIAREEHVIPIFQPVVSDTRPLSTNTLVEGRGLLAEKFLYQPSDGGDGRAVPAPESRMLHTFAIPENRQPPMPIFDARFPPSENVRPPPPPPPPTSSPPAFHKIPIHVPTVLQQVESQQRALNENILDEQVENDPRPHYVQPRSVRSVDSQMHQNLKRTRRYACSCTC